LHYGDAIALRGRDSITGTRYHYGDGRDTITGTPITAITGTRYELQNFAIRVDARLSRPQPPRPSPPYPKPSISRKHEFRGESVDAVADRVLAASRISQDEALRAGRAQRARLQGAGASPSSWRRLARAAGGERDGKSRRNFLKSDPRGGEGRKRGRAVRRAGRHCRYPAILHRDGADRCKRRRVETPPTF